MSTVTIRPSAASSGPVPHIPQRISPLVTVQNGLQLTWRSVLKIKANPEEVFGLMLQPVMFVILFVSSAFFPRDLLTPTLHDIAAFNPLTYVVETARALLLDLDYDLWKCFVAATVLAGATLALAVFALAERLRRT